MVRSLSAAAVLYAICLSVIFVPVTSAQRLAGEERRSSKKSNAKIETPESGPLDEAEPIKPGDPSPLAPAAGQTDIVGPAGSGVFGQAVQVLPNGNIVITDPLYDITSPAVIADVGAVYLYDGDDLSLISQLTGSSANDRVGSGGVTVLANGNFVVRSNLWDRGGIADVGAATWASATTGVSGVVSEANSLVGSSASDSVGGVFALTNGNYVASTSSWDRPGAANAGAVTWGNGTTGIAGEISSSNSLVGSTANDQVGSVRTLPNGNYLVSSSQWDNGSNVDAGAVTWGSGIGGVSGTISATNSLVGSNAVDQIGSGIGILTNGNYVVVAEQWGTADLGSATWGDGNTGVKGVVSAANSLVGSTASDRVGRGLYALNNGNYVVISELWHNGAVPSAGAVTWGNGAGGTVGVVSTANSWVGSSDYDKVGYGGILPLTNGNYVILSPEWRNGGVLRAGAATFANGSAGSSGIVTASNSLVGSSSGDMGSIATQALTNGNYVIANYTWDNGAAAADAGAVTWGSGTTGVAGAISAANSLVGTTTSDTVGNFVVVLSNGNYVVSSPQWDNGATANVGAATFGNGTNGTAGAVTSSNSLVGSAAGDNVGNGSVAALTNGNYLVRSWAWRNGTATQAGAVTFGNGTTGITGVVSENNSLVGSATDDGVGGNSVLSLANGNYLVCSSQWDNGGIQNAGAATWGSGTTGVKGTISQANSLVGGNADDFICSDGAFALANGNYVVRSTRWGANDLGAVTWGSGTQGIAGLVSQSNSLVGSTTNDNVGTVRTFANGNYAVVSPNWDNGTTVNARAVTYGAGNGGTAGPISSQNSVLGTTSVGVVDIATPIDAPISNERLIVRRPATNVVTVFSPTYTAVADGNWSSAGTWNFGAFTKGHDWVIPNGRTVTLNADIPQTNGATGLTIDQGGSLVVSGDRTSGSSINNSGILDISLGKLGLGANRITFGCDSIINGAGSSTYVTGGTAKDFCAPGAFRFPVGTANGYSPLDVNVTALTSGTANLAVDVTQSVHPDLYAPNSLKRWWSIEQTGALTADLTFNYLDGDVIGNESAYRLFKKSSGVLTAPSGYALDASANKMSINGVSTFSEWAIGIVAPTAAPVSVTGRVLTADGRPVSRANVSFVDAMGATKFAVTNSFGYYRVDELTAGASYIASVRAKGLIFEAQVISPTASVAGFDFVAR